MRNDNDRRKRRRRRRLLRRIILRIILIISLIILLFNINHIINLFAKMPVMNHKTVVVIDAGHGGKDPGANYDQIMEKNINLSVAKLVKNLLKDKDIKVIMTRDKDEAVDLHKRAVIANKVDADIFVSIHCNDLESGGQANGIETYYYSDDKQESKQLANEIQKQLIFLTNANDRGARTEDLAVIRETNMPAVLTEIGFLSDEAEQKNLLDDDYQEKIAKGIAEGITEYLNELNDSNTDQ